METVGTESKKYKEEDYLLLKTVRCPICDNTFRSLQLKSGKARRKDADLDLCPHFEQLDANKYDIASCPKCGFTAMNRFLTPMPSVQVKYIKEGFCDKFKTPPTQALTELKSYTYDESIQLYKLALYASTVKKGKVSETAYVSLKIAWLFRGKIQELAADKEKNKGAILAAQKEYVTFYTQAFDGFIKAMTSENYPICGMDQNTMDLLIAAMAYNLGKYDYAARFVSGLLVSKTAGSNIKNRAHDLKEMIIEKVKK